MASWYQQGGIEKFIPVVRNTREAPMATVLEHVRCPRDLDRPINRRMPIFPVGCHLCDIKIKHRCFHFWYHSFQGAHHPWIRCKACLVGNRFCFSITPPASTIQLPFPVKKITSTKMSNPNLLYPHFQEIINVGDAQICIPEMRGWVSSKEHPGAVSINVSVNPNCPCLQCLCKRLFYFHFVIHLASFLEVIFSANLTPNNGYQKLVVINYSET